MTSAFMDPARAERVDGPPRPLATPDRGTSILVHLEPVDGDPVEAPGVGIDGVLIEALPGGLWWAPGYGDELEFVPWRLVRLVETDSGSRA